MKRKHTEPLYTVKRHRMAAGQWLARLGTPDGRHDWRMRHDFAYRLDTTERALRADLATWGAVENAATHPEAANRWSVPRTAPEEAQHYVRLLALVDRVRVASEGQKPREAFFLGLALGEARLFDFKEAIVARRHQQHNGRAAVARKNKEAEQRRREIRKIYPGIKQRIEYDFHRAYRTKIVAAIAAKLDLNMRTVRRDLLKLAL